MTMPRTITADEAAMQILLSRAPEAEKQRALEALNKQVQIALGDECPECGGTDIEDNGCHGDRLSYRCTSCDHRWGPGEEI